MQMPMPHSGPRASPQTENRHGSPAIIIAAATLVPAATFIDSPFTLIVQLSLVTRTFPWMRFHRSTGYAGFLLLLRTIAPYCGRVVRRNSLGTVSNIHTQTSAALDENRVEYVFETGSNNLDHVTN